jgi:glycosyltransferase involved in cell wall biosynthesis
MDPKKVAVLMATYNGEKFLAQQLDSIAEQTYSNWCLYVLDDGSTDKTWQILQEYQTRIGAEKMQISRQPNQGASKTFLALVCNTEIQAEYFAYADQDDVWDKDKIERAITILEKHPEKNIQLYCSTARLIDKENKIIGYLPLAHRKMCFQNALVQNIAPGNTMVFNKGARKILAFTGITNIIVHDAWTYIALSACDSFLYYDTKPTLSYRQHDNNLIGFDRSITRYSKVLKRILSGTYSRWYRWHIQALHILDSFTTPEAKRTLNIFEKALQGNFVQRAYWLKKSGIFRQSTIDTIKLYLIIIFVKI